MKKKGKETWTEKLEKMTALLVKCVVVGDGAVGKTSLLDAYTQHTFTSEYVPTIFDNLSVMTTIDNQVIQLSLWDTAGQDDYDRLRPLSYPQTDVFILCYSVVSPPSLAHVRLKWVPELRYYCPQVPILLVGTKMDLIDDLEMCRRLQNRGYQPLSLKEGEKVSKSLQLAGHMWCSSYTGVGVDEVFSRAIRAHLLTRKDSSVKNRKTFERISGCTLL